MVRKPQPAPFDGALVMDKPRGRTSHDIVEAVRRVVGFRQIGHLGTLDPLGTGVLVLLLGRATRLAQFYAGRRKRYACAVRFGFATDTYDADGTPLGPDTAPALDPAEIERLAGRFVGRLTQMPPSFSAKKVHGRPAHELARKKKHFELKPIEVQVYEFRLTGVEGSLARFVIECAAGTYIRSLAHEMGAQLGCGAHLAEIVRTAVGEFTIDQAMKLEELEQAAKSGRLGEWILPLERLLPDLPRVTVLPLVERRVRHGTRFNVQLAQIQPGRVPVAQGAPSELNSGEWRPARLRVFNHQEKLIAIAEAVVPRTYQPVVVLDAAP
ncbi:MAG TPA: tRNA pseudouridine(55) synthase TruB [Candidatus Acidoferrales bacterium]|jgi:tRNA pseudouridine55 synthase|nr:tRNA pseudouridine(55) synthase TruB [Candidatus Acidoferrales bacterium]